MKKERNREWIFFIFYLRFVFYGVFCFCDLIFDYFFVEIFRFYNVIVKFIKMVLIFDSGVGSVVLYVWYIYEFFSVDLVCVF